jgi:hypothetical protein
LKLFRKKETIVNYRIAACAALSALSLATPLTARAAGLTPGMYEYTVKMNMPGMPAGMGAQTFQRCLTAQDVAGTNAYSTARDKNSDCKIKDLRESGSQFSYSMSCTKPEKMEATTKGTVTATSLSMDMTMSMPDAGGTMTQTTTAKRIGDCK